MRHSPSFGYWAGEQLRCQLRVQSRRRRPTSTLGRSPQCLQQRPNRYAAMHGRDGQDAEKADRLLRHVVLLLQDSPREGVEGRRNRARLQTIIVCLGRDGGIAALQRASGSGRATPRHPSNKGLGQGRRSACLSEPRARLPLGFASVAASREGHCRPTSAVTDADQSVNAW
jgi:hypothetical protein